MANDWKKIIEKHLSPPAPPEWDEKAEDQAFADYFKKGPLSQIKANPAWIEVSGSQLGKIDPVQPITISGGFLPASLFLDPSIPPPPTISSQSDPAIPPSTEANIQDIFDTFKQITSQNLKPDTMIMSPEFYDQLKGITAEEIVNEQPMASLVSKAIFGWTNKTSEENLAQIKISNEVSVDSGYFSEAEITYLKKHVANMTEEILRKRQMQFAKTGVVPDDESFQPEKSRLELILEELE